VKARLVIDDAVGERRRVLLDEQGRPFRLSLERWSERGRRVLLDQVRWGRVTARIPGNRGWFVDLGVGQDGVVEPTHAARVVEGAMLAFRVKSEAWGDKGPVLSLADMSPGAMPPKAPLLHAEPPADAFLSGIDVAATITGPDARTLADAAIDEALSAVVPLQGGGDIAVDATRGATVIDVDGGDRTGGGDAERFALELNAAAAEAAARQVSLRGLGGLVFIDFVTMHAPAARRSVVQRFRDQLALNLGRSSDVLELTRLGVCEAAIARRSRPVRDAVAAPAGEREALDALRLLETAGEQNRAGRLKARVSGAAAAWLESDPVGWRDALADRIGLRWTIETADASGGRPQVWSE
jgi:Ribonuclease G/E